MVSVDCLPLLTWRWEGMKSGSQSTVWETQKIQFSSYTQSKTTKFKPVKRNQFLQQQHTTLDVDGSVVVL